MAEGVAALSGIFSAELVIILVLLTITTYYLTYKPVVAHIREIYFVHSQGFKRAWYLVIAAISMFLVAQISEYFADRGSLELRPGVATIFEIVFGTLIIIAFIQLILIFKRYVPRFFVDEKTVQDLIVKDIRKAIQLMDAKQNLYLDVSLGADIYAGRPTLGPTLSLSHYRGVMLGMTQYLEKRFGDLGDSILFAVGRQTGRSAANSMVAEVGSRDKLLDMFLENMYSAGMGIPKVLQATDERVNIQFNECCICSGIEPTREPECHYISGLFSGLFEAITGGFVEVKEVKCNSKRDAYCEFQVDIVQFGRKRRAKKAEAAAS